MITLTQHDRTITQSPGRYAVRLVDGCGNSRVVELSTSAVALEWTCPFTGLTTVFKPWGSVTDGRRRPLWLTSQDRATGRVHVTLRSPHAPRPNTDSALWAELYRAVPPMPSAILEALLRGHDEDAIL